MNHGEHIDAFRQHLVNNPVIAFKYFSYPFIFSFRNKFS